MTKRERIDAALEYLAGRGVKPLVAAPLGWRLLRRLGLNIPPPLFMGFAPLALLTGLAFGLPITAGGFVFLTVVGAPARWPVVVTSAIGGAVFGAIMAAQMRWQARRHGVPRWRDFDPTAPDADDAW